MKVVSIISTAILIEHLRPKLCKYIFIIFIFQPIVDSKNYLLNRKFGQFEGKNGNQEMKEIRRKLILVQVLFTFLNFTITSK